MLLSTFCFIFLLNLTGLLHASVIPSSPKTKSSHTKPVITTRELKMAEYLQNFGYIEKKLSLNEMKLKDFIPMCAKALRAFQNYHGLSETGEFDAATENEMNQPRCFNDDDDILQLVKERREKTLADDKSGSDFDDLRAVKSVWPKGRTSPLTYSVDNIPKDLSRRKVLRNIKQAIEEWADNSGLEVRLVTEGGDIEMKFAPLDKEWEVLGRGYYPQRGLVIFDSMEDWKLDSSSSATGPHLKKVALHEVGHALGITHSDNRNTIMYPNYRHSLEGLTFDDLKAIQEAYGKPENRNSLKNKPVESTSPLGQGTKRRLKILNTEPETNFRVETFREVTVSEEINRQTNREVRTKENSEEEKVFRDEKKHSRVSSSRTTNRNGEVSTEVLDKPRSIFNRRSSRRRSSSSSGKRGRRTSTENGENKSENKDTQKRKELLGLESANVGSEEVRKADSVEEREINSVKERETDSVEDRETNSVEERETDSVEERAINSVEEKEIDSQLDREVVSERDEFLESASSAESTNDKKNSARRGRPSRQHKSSRKARLEKHDDASESEDVIIQEESNNDSGPISFEESVEDQEASKSHENKDGSQSTQSREVNIDDNSLPSDSPSMIDSALVTSHGPSVPFNTRATSSIQAVRDLTSGRFTGAVSKMPLDRFAVVGRWRGVELVDTQPNTRMDFAESLLWSSKGLIEASVESMVMDPVKMTSVKDGVLIVDRARHCLLQLTASGVEVVAGKCGTSGTSDGNLLSAEFDTPVDVCKAGQDSGTLLVLDQGSSKIRLVQKDSGVVSTYFDLPTDTLFTSMSCKAGLIYMSANTESESQIYKLELRNVRSSHALTKVVGIPRGQKGQDGLTGSHGGGSAIAYGEFNSVSCTGDVLYLRDGNVLREMDLMSGGLNTVCGETDQFFIGKAGDCSITKLAGTERIDDTIYGLDSQHKKLFTITSQSTTSTTDDPFEHFFTSFR